MYHIQTDDFCKDISQVHLCCTGSKSCLVVKKTSESYKYVTLTNEYRIQVWWIKTVEKREKLRYRTPDKEEIQVSCGT